MSKTNNKITLHGNPVEVMGDLILEGQAAPSVTLVNNDLKDVELSSFKGKVIVLSVVPSLDTPTCQVQTRTFNQESSNLGSDVVVLTVSRDLPFAQKRWCGAEGIDRVITLSDYKYRTFGKAFGVDIPNISLLARAVFVIDKNSKVVLTQYVDEISAEPVYDEVISAVKSSL